MRTWQRQVKDFGHTEADKYSVLIFDNRGMGDSDKPLLRYTTSEMAKDVVELLDHVGWTQDRSVHLIGISMGGMISQELVSARLDLATTSDTTVGSPQPNPVLQYQPDLHSTSYCAHETFL